MLNNDSTVSTFASRANKKIEALDPLYFNIEERTTADFLLFIEKLATHVRYYDLQNIETGNWNGFFSSHEVFIIIKLSNWNIDLLRNNWLEILKSIDNTISNNEQQAICLAYFEKTYNNLLQQKQSITNIKDQEIRNFFLEPIAIIEAQYNTIIEILEKSTSITQLLANPYFEKSIAKFFGLLQSWTSSSNAKIKDQFQTNKHHPHIALLITFLDLMQYAQRSLNTFSKNHLDFYYINKLGFEKNKGKPESVYLQVEPKNTTLLIPENTAFLGDKDDNGIQKIYKTTINQTVDNVAITEIIAAHATVNGLVHTNLLSKINNNKPVNPFEETGNYLTNTIAIASKILWLQSGTRKINFEIHTTIGNYKDSISIKLSGAKKWIAIDNIYPNIQGIYTINLKSDDDAIINYDAKIHDGYTLVENLPVIIIAFNKYNPNLSIKQININVAIENLEHFIVEGEHGNIDHTKPFLPFGNMPVNNSVLKIYIPEFFQKRNSYANVSILYNDATFNAYKLLLEDKDATTNIGSAFTNTHVAKIESSLEEKYKHAALILKLNNSNYNNQKYLESIVSNAKSGSAILYLPKIEKITINYNAHEQLEPGKPLKDTICYKIAPKGQHLVKKLPIIFDDPNQSVGQIVIGIENKKAGDLIQLFFQLQLNGTNPLIDNARVTIAYLHKNNWNLFESASITDGTFGLIQSGMMNMVLPEDLDNTTNSMLNNNCTWIKIETDNKNNFNKIIGIHTQTIIAHLDTKDNYVFNAHTAASVIKKSLDNKLAIKKITQHYSSFGGAIAETDAAFYQNSSQILKHKNRAITPWDIETLILEQIDEVESVKVLSHFKSLETSTCNLSAGYVTIVPIAKIQPDIPIHWQAIINKQTVNKINELLINIASPHARIRIQLPKLEQLKITCKINIKEEAKYIDTNIVRSKIHDAINALLSPWAFTNLPVTFFETISVSKIIQAIETVSFVDYISDLSIQHFEMDENGKTKKLKVVKEYVKALTPYSIFIPASNHEIEFIK